MRTLQQSRKFAGTRPSFGTLVIVVNSLSLSLSLGLIVNVLYWCYPKQAFCKINGVTCAKGICSQVLIDTLDRPSVYTSVST